MYLSFFSSVFLSFCLSVVLSFSLVLSFSDVSRFGHLHVFLSVDATSSYIAPFLFCFLSLHLCIFDVLVSFFSVSCRIITQSLQIVLRLSKSIWVPGSLLLSLSLSLLQFCIRSFFPFLSVSQFVSVFLSLSLSFSGSQVLWFTFSFSLASSLSMSLSLSLLISTPQYLLVPSTFQPQWHSECLPQLLSALFVCLSPL